MLSGRRLIALSTIVAALALGAVLIPIRSGPSRPRPDEGVANAAPVSVRVGRSKLGEIVVDRRGRTLYLFILDRDGRSHCYSACARLWPPAMVFGRPTAGRGLTAAKLTTIARAGEARQLVYNGHPLYTLADERPGQVDGQRYAGTWFVLSPTGQQIGRGRPTTGY